VTGPRVARLARIVRVRDLLYTHGPRTRTRRRAPLPSLAGGSVNRHALHASYRPSAITAMSSVVSLSFRTDMIGAM
jgi:hypothetical protein